MKYWRLLLVVCGGLIVGSITASENRWDPLILAYADELLAAEKLSSKVHYNIDPALADREAFFLNPSDDAWKLRAGGAAGILYGVQELILPHSVVEAEGAPDFSTRGAVLMMLSASWAYQSELSPERYPWFFDRELMKDYLDYLFTARLNTLVLWSGHLFPHILELPEYPEASRFSGEEIRRNQEQFRWLTTECAKRNIQVLTHFYNIHISADLARSLGREGDDPTRYTAPDDFVSEYYRTMLERYFETFPNVGLYICPGESLALEHQADWFENVIFAAARASGLNPTLVIRDWTLDPAFQERLPEMYPNLQSELKHNDETITSPWPDLRHRQWKGVLRGHIINLHDPSDATPYRVGSPRLLGEMVSRWKDEGYITGAWWYPPQSWIWPDTLDRIPRGGAGEEGRLLTFERDELWHLLEGRLLWRAGREPENDRKWAADWLGRKFGNPAVGRLLVDWYDLTGPILPGLQNVTAVRFGNFFPPSIARVQTDVDEILSSRLSLEEGPLEGATGLTGQRYYSRPIDAFTLERYQAEYQTGPLKDLRSLPVAQMVAAQVAGDSLKGYVRPDQLLDLYAGMAADSAQLARQGAALGGSDPAELERFAHDSECLQLTVAYYRHKLLAAVAKRRFELTGEATALQAFRARMEASVPAYEAMYRYAHMYYTAGSAMWDAKPWARTFEDRVKADYRRQMEWIQAVE
jgi:hypothetical protein